MLSTVSGRLGIGCPTLMGAEAGSRSGHRLGMPALRLTSLEQLLLSSWRHTFHEPMREGRLRGANAACLPMSGRVKLVPEHGMRWGSGGLPLLAPSCRSDIWPLTISWPQRKLAARRGPQESPSSHLEKYQRPTWSSELATRHKSYWSRLRHSPNQRWLDAAA